MFARRDNASKGVRGCSHLVCAADSGDKYRASVRWGVPAVTKHWLVACLKEGERLDEQLYHPGLALDVAVEEDAKAVLQTLISKCATAVLLWNRVLPLSR